MSKVTCSLKVAPGLTMVTEQEYDTFFVVVGKWAIELTNTGNLVVGEYRGAGYRERPVFTAPADD